MRWKVLILLAFCSSCSKKQNFDDKPDVFTLREMSDLATVEYTVTKIIKANDNKTWFKVGNRRILMSCKAYIKAGVDMNGINKNSFKISGKDIVVNLPPPKIISFNIPAESIKTEFEEIGILRDNYTSSDRNALAVQAEKQIKSSIDSLGILEQATVNTTLFVTKFLKQLGYENIRVNYQMGTGQNMLR